MSSESLRKGKIGWIVALSLTLPPLLLTWIYLICVISIPSACVFPCDRGLVQSGFFLYSVLAFLAVPAISIALPPIGIFYATLVLAEVSYLSGWKMPVLKVVSAKKLWLLVVTLNALAWLAVGVDVWTGYPLNVLAVGYAPVATLLAAISVGIVMLFRKMDARNNK